MKPFGYIFIGMIMGTPNISSAAVTISEIAWMGNEESANNEWIELANTNADPTILDGWTLDDGNTLEITIQGTLPANGFAVLERSDDNSSPVPALLIYTGALSNEGRTLSLRNSSGALIDRVVGGENWSAVGGNNETKETAQHTTSGWVTAAATPGKENKSTTQKQASVAEIVTSPQSTSAAPRGAGKSISLTVPKNTLSLSIQGPRLGQEKQEVVFEAVPSGIGSQIADSLTYTWNFGDLAIATGSRVRHSFEYPGEYLVTLQATYIRHDEMTQHHIVILPITFSLVRTAEGNIQLHNTAKYDVDISGFRIVADHEVAIPEQTFIPAGGVITVTKSRLEDSGERFVALYNQQDELIASLVPAALMNTIVQEQIPTKSEVRDASLKKQTMEIVADTKALSQPSPLIPQVLREIDQYPEVRIGYSDTPNRQVSQFTMTERITYATLIGIIIIGALGLSVRPKDETN